MSDGSQETHDPLLGRAMGRFTLRARLGSGAIGSVYRADDGLTGAAVAVKVLHPDVARSAHAAKRLEREAAFARRIVHPNVARVIEVGTHDGLPFVAMELIAGRSLDEVVAREGALTPERAARIASGVVAALAEAHGQGIVHRDLKPANVMLAGQGAGEQAKLVDFGVARVLDDDDSTAPLTRLTREGFTVGTPAYMAPEQFSSAQVGPEADLYAVGLVLHEMLTGRPAFAGTLREVVVKQMTELPPALPPYEGLGPLVARLTVKEQGDRPASAAAVHAELAEILRSIQRTRIVGTEATVLDGRALASDVPDAGGTERTFAAVVSEAPPTRESRVVLRPVAPSRARHVRAVLAVSALLTVVAVAVWWTTTHASRGPDAPPVPAPLSVRAPTAAAIASPEVEADPSEAAPPIESPSPEPSPPVSPSVAPVSAPPTPAASPRVPAASRAPPRAARTPSPRAGSRTASEAARRRVDPCRPAAVEEDRGKLCFDHVDATLRSKTLEPGHRLWKRYSDLWLRNQYPQTAQEHAASMSALRALAREVDRLP